ncbi:phosphodiester glycosidase family protein [Desulfitobacterium sp. AusDCA]|uniref:phosphodiester glycosidase family protein n=1 Tax=Desulfitobacterium sp. AusDCA TaxID=3240383 RepID=UPI003DA78841
MKTKTKKIRWKMIIAFIAFNLVLTVLLAPFIVFWGPFESLKVMAVGSIATSRHPQVARIFLSQEKIDELMHAYDSAGTFTGLNVERDKVVTDPSTGITIEDIKGPNFKGKVMLIKDPKRVQVAVTKEIGVAGERVSDFVKDTGAVAAINAGGFYDPNGKGNGAFPDGLTVHNGEIVHNNVGNKTVNIVAIDKDGKLIIGDMSADQIEQKHIKEAVSFYPNLVENGKPAVSGDGGWGIAPRTGIGQTADGTIIFLVIDGRQPTWSIGATLRDMMNIFLDYHAVNAVNLDGGSSSELVYNGKVMNKLWNVFGERYIPTAFVVMPK